MTYPGGKNGHGVYQAIINQIPPHKTYIEAFAGSAAVFRHKKPAKRNVLIELDEAQANELIAQFHDDEFVEVFHACAIDYLERLIAVFPDTFIYFDPPYVMESRKSQRPIYKHEWTLKNHVQFLGLVQQLDCSIAISGYQSDLYDEALSDWRCVTFTAQTRHGPATEYLWMNYPEPTVLHDCRYVGDGFRERDRIKKLAKRRAAGFMRLSPLERQAVLSKMIERARSCITGTDDECRISSPELAMLASLANYGDKISHDISGGYPDASPDVAMPAHTTVNNADAVPAASPKLTMPDSENPNAQSASPVHFDRMGLKTPCGER